jgi:hypothetical protein
VSNSSDLSSPRILVRRDSRNSGTMEAGHEPRDGAEEDGECGPTSSARSRLPKRSGRCRAARPSWSSAGSFK